jgi:hypothetical protein
LILNDIYIKLTEMDLLDRYLASTPNSGKVTNNLDKTPIEPDGGLNLAINQSRIKNAGGRDLGNGAGGWNPTNKYSDSGAN